MEEFSFFEEEFSYEPRMISSKCFSVSSFASFVLIAIMTASTVVSININNNNNNNNNNNKLEFFHNQKFFELCTYDLNLFELGIAHFAGTS